ncbi:hypothetical protein NXZ84_04840 [Mechercharimyces sp. CAU 1602]|nr:hypothetical protein [Mechercharimyces sp. CAU 1602]
MSKTIVDHVNSAEEGYKAVYIDLEGNFVSGWDSHLNSWYLTKGMELK